MQIAVGKRLDQAGASIIPITDRIGPEIYVVVRCRRPVDVDSTENSITVLCREMGMVPGYKYGLTRFAADKTRLT